MTDTTPGAERAASEKPPSDDSLAALVARLKQLSEDGYIDVGEVVDAFGDRAHAPLLLVPALVSILPFIGMLPGVTWTTSALVLFFSAQGLVLRRRPWVPARVRALRAGAGSLLKGLEMSQPLLDTLGRIARPRLTWLASGPFATLLIALCFLMGIVMFVLSVIPGGVVPPALVVMLLAFALMARDGLLALVAYALCGGAVALALWAPARLGAWCERTGHWVCWLVPGV